MSEYQIQLVVVAGGPAGLAAAVAAAEKGVHVAVLEKRAIPGGLANSGMGILAIESHYQKEAGVDLTVEKAMKMMMEYEHYNIDGRLLRRYFGQSADTIEWLEGTDIEYINQILSYTEDAEHDDAPDSAACVCRIYDRQSGEDYQSPFARRERGLYA